jgi:hypothetical protein
MSALELNALHVTVCTRSLQIYMQVCEDNGLHVDNCQWSFLQRIPMASSLYGNHLEHVHFSLSMIGMGSYNAAAVGPWDVLLDLCSDILRWAAYGWQRRTQTSIQDTFKAYNLY